jgi:hypothetical protein
MPKRSRKGGGGVGGSGASAVPVEPVECRDLYQLDVLVNNGNRSVREIFRVYGVSSFEELSGVGCMSEPGREDDATAGSGVDASAVSEGGAEAKRRKVAKSPTEKPPKSSSAVTGVPRKSSKLSQGSKKPPSSSRGRKKTSARPSTDKGATRAAKGRKGTGGNSAEGKRKRRKEPGPVAKKSSKELEYDAPPTLKESKLGSFIVIKPLPEDDKKKRFFRIGKLESCSPNGKTAEIHFWETYSEKSRSAKALSSSVKFFPAWYDGKNEVYQNATKITSVRRKLHPIVWTIQDTDVVFVFPGMEKNKIPSKIVRIANQLFTLRRKGGTSQSRAK